MGYGAKVSFFSSASWMTTLERREFLVSHSFLLLLLRKIVLLPSYLLVLLIRLLKWLVTPPVLLLQVLIGVPLTLLRVRQPLRPQFIPLQETDLPDAAWITLTDTAEALAAEGFVTCGDFRCDEMIQGATLWLRLLSQPELGISALAVRIETEGGIRLTRQFTEFSTEFVDGRVLDTNNLSLPYSLPAPTYLARVQLKDVWDPRALFALHHGLVASLPGTISQDPIKRAKHDPATLLADHYSREIRALVEQGWLRLDDDGSEARLRPWAALVSVWRQAWPLASGHLRAADRRSRRLLAEHGLDVEQFIGGAMTIQVSRQPLETTASIDTVLAGYEHVGPVARQTDPRAVLEAVVVELGRDATETVILQEFRYSFRGWDNQPERRIRRLRGFDILLDPTAGALAVTAMEREFEQAADEAEWAELVAVPPCVSLRLDPWLRDLDRVLPAAHAALIVRATTTGKTIALDSASLYLDEERPRWQVVAWMEDDTPLHVVLDARSGAVLDD